MDMGIETGRICDTKNGLELIIGTEDTQTERYYGIQKPAIIEAL